MRPQFNIIIPLFNEELIFSDLVSRLNDVMDTVVNDVRVSVILIDDGSKDNTYEIVKAAFENNPLVKVLTKPNGMNKKSITKCR